jgi:hypothetical protein
MHDIEATRVKIDLPLMTFIKALYPTYSHYLESLQASDQMKSMTFEKLVKKVADREKAFGKKSTPSTGETVYLAQKDKSKQHDSSRGESNRRGRGRGRKSFRGRGVDTTKVIDPIFIVPVAKRMGHMKQMTAEFHGTRSKKTDKIRKRTKVNLQNQQKVIHLNLPITLLLTAI